MSATTELGDVISAIHYDAHAEAASARSRRSTERNSDADVVEDSKSIGLEIPADCSGVTPTEAEKSSDSSQKITATKRRARIQFSSLCFVLFLAGWDGGTSGPLIPRMQEFYHVNYTVVSLTFVMNCIGFLLGATMNVYMTDRWGFGKSWARTSQTLFRSDLIIISRLGSIGQVIGYAMMAPAPPFAVLCVAYLINGWGISLQDAQSNGFVASLSENSAAKMGLMHALYGFGAVCSPFSATQFAEMPRLWSYHYLISLGIAVINVAFLVSVFKGKTQDECLHEIEEAAAEVGTSEANKYKQILSQKVVHLLAFFSLVYVGVEFTIGGWTVTYIINRRHGGVSSGYVSTGFFGGLTLGRVCLLWANKKVGEHLIIFIYTLLALGLELIVWLVPSLVGDAVAVSFVGFVLGPMYPILMNETGRLIAPWLLTGSIGWIASFGFTGSALFPFITGALSSHFGIASLQPLLIILMASMLVLWALVPSGNCRQTDTD